jgi:hypothetical protein
MTGDGYKPPTKIMQPTDSYADTDLILPPFGIDAEMRRTAECVARRRKHQRIDIDKWAARLAEDVKNAGD